MRTLSKGRLTVGSLSAVLRTFVYLVIAAAAFMLVLKISIAGAYQEANPARALAWAPFDANARAQAAALILASGDSPEVRTQARSLAVEAIVRDPTRVVALRTLGLVADAEGDRRRARFVLAQVQRLSRRDQPTQVWLVHDQYRLGNPAGMVRHFDIAARTSERVWALVFPVLVTASSDPRIGAALAERLVRKPNWWLPFVNQLVATGPQLRQVVALTRGLLDPDVPEERAVIEIMLQRLTDAGEYDLAWTVFGEATEGRRAAAPDGYVRDGGFEASGGFAPFDWLFARAPDLEATRQPRPDSRPGSALSLIARNGRSGEVARQLQRLPPGGYRLEAEMGAIPSDAFGRPVLGIACAGGARPSALLSLRPRESGSSVRRLAGGFSVPAGCRWQWLTVQVGGDGPPSEVAPWIDNVAILRATSSAPQAARP